MQMTRRGGEDGAARSARCRANLGAPAPPAAAATNIPTELLRALVAVVDLRSFTKAAQSLGVTQPAVSAQVKRLQAMLGMELLDKSAPGVSLTSAGERVITYARRLLSINDQILDIAGPRPGAKLLRVGATGDFTAARITLGLSLARARSPDLRFEVYNAGLEVLMRDLREATVDLAVWLSVNRPALDTSHHWTEPMVWVRSAATQIDPSRPLPLVSHGDNGAFTRLAMDVLSQAGRCYEPVFIAPGLLCLSAAIAGGFGVMALPRSRAELPGVSVWHDAPLPSLPDLHAGISVRPGADYEEREQIAATIAGALRPRATAGTARGPAI